MRAPLSLRIARRELRGGLRGFRVFLACLALGIAAIAAVGSVRDSIEAGLTREAATLLGGDATVELSYRFATPAERGGLRLLAQEMAEIVDFRSMVAAGRGADAPRALTEIKGVDGAYPLYGEVRLDPAMPLPTALAGRDGRPGLVMAPLLIDRLGLAPGDPVWLGTKEFVLMAALTREPDDTGTGFDLGPRTLLRTVDLDGTGLLGEGTLYETEYYLRLPPGTDLDATRSRAEAALSGGGFRWRDTRDGAPGLSQFVDRLSAFLVLVGLAGLTVGGVGVAAAVRAHLDEKVATIATLKTLGATGGTIFRIYLIQIGVLAGLGIALGLILGGLAPLALAPLIQARLPVPAEFGLHPRPLAEAALYGVLGAALFTLWPLARTERIRAATLFRDTAGRARIWPRPPYLAVTFLLAASLVLAAVLLSGLPRLALWSAAGLIGAFTALLLVGAALRRLARRAARGRTAAGRPAWRLALASVGGPGGEAASVVLSLGLGLTVLAAVGQVDANLRRAIAQDLPDIAPSFFVVDIQPGQLDGFLGRLDADPDVSRVENAPMLRGIITRIGGRPAEEVAGDHWVLHGDRGVTYSARPPAGTQITAGQWWPDDYAGPPQISFAAEEGAELGLSLGDSLTVNILGRDITGTITSFREVDFSNAGLSFVLAMNPGALAGAPHTSIATIYADPAAEGRLFRDLASTYPNITLISVRDAVNRATDILGGIAAAVTAGALATLITGAVVLIGAAAAGVRARTFEAAILKTLGATRRTILTSFALRSALTGAAAGTVAVAAGGLAGWAVMRFVMDTEYVFAPVSAAIVILGGMAVSTLAGLAFAWRPLASRPARVLRARE
ncbi:MAG: ABC transporter permease [Tranquillimonas sp.]